MELARDHRLEALKAWLRKHDDEYIKLFHESAETSSAVMGILYAIDKADTFNKFEDTHHAAAFYLEDMIYAQGFFDAYAMLKGIPIPPAD